MAGLDTRGFADGFARGFGLMDRHYQRQAQQEQNEQRMDMARERLGLQRQQVQMRQDEAESRHQWQQKKQDRQEQQWQRQDNNETLTNIYAKANTYGWDSLGDVERRQLQHIAETQPGRLPPELQEFASQNRQYDPASIESGIAKILQGQDLDETESKNLASAPVQIQRLGSDEMEADIQAIDQQMAMIAEGKNQITPEALQAVNNLYDDQIGPGKRIVGIYPGQTPGTLVFNLEVEDEDGNRRHAPMTAGRGTEADDDHEIKEIPVERFIDSLHSAKAAHMTFKANPKARENLQRWAVSAGLIKQPEEQWRIGQDPAVIQSIGPYQQNARTGKITPLSSKNGRQPNRDWARNTLDEYRKSRVKAMNDSELGFSPQQAGELKAVYARTFGLINPDDMDVLEQYFAGQSPTPNDLNEVVDRLNAQYSQDETEGKTKAAQEQAETRGPSAAPPKPSANNENNDKNNTPHRGLDRAEMERTMRELTKTYSTID